jgi:hypothetical protein
LTREDEIERGGTSGVAKAKEKRRHKRISKKSPEASYRLAATTAGK